MKILLVISLIFFLNFNCMNEIGNLSDSDEKLTLIEYNFSSGAISPEYQYSYKVLINSYGSCFYLLHKGDDNLTEMFSISNQKFAELSDKIISSGIMNGNVASLPSGEIPDGSASEWIVLLIENTNPDLDQPPKKIEIPPHVEKKFEASLNEIYLTIKNLIPNEIKKRDEK